MLRAVNGHEVNADAQGASEANSQLSILADEAGAGGASHVYLIGNTTTERHMATVSFQNGPIAECGVNGLTHEALLTIIADRLTSFQEGPYACDFNEVALAHVLMARNALLQRTRERQGRGVEGTHAI